MKKIKVDAFIPMPVVPTVIVGANVDGKANYLTVGFVSGVNIKPPIIGISLNRRHFTVKGILENGTFSVNVPSAEHILETDYCGLVSGRSVDKGALFSTFYGELKTAPMIEQMPIVCECRYTGKKADFAMDTVYFGEIIRSYVNADLYTKGQPADISRINPLLTGLDRQYHIPGNAIGKTFSIGWDYVSKNRSRSANGVDCTIVNRSPRHILFIRCALQDNNIGKKIEALQRHAEKQGETPLEGPFVLRKEDMEQEAEFSVGFAFRSFVNGEGEIEEGKMSGGRYASALYIGPYEKMSRVVSDIHTYASKHGLKGKGLMYELYLNDPSLTPPDLLQTKILLPLQRMA